MGLAALVLLWNVGQKLAGMEGTLDMLRREQQADRASLPGRTVDALESRRRGKRQAEEVYSAQRVTLWRQALGIQCNGAQHPGTNLITTALHCFRAWQGTMTWAEQVQEQARAAGIWQMGGSSLVAGTRMQPAWGVLVAKDVTADHAEALAQPPSKWKGNFDALLLTEALETRAAEVEVAARVRGHCEGVMQRHAVMHGFEDRSLTFHLPVLSEALTPFCIASAASGSQSPWVVDASHLGTALHLAGRALSSTAYCYATATGVLLQGSTAHGISGSPVTCSALEAGRWHVAQVALTSASHNTTAAAVAAVPSGDYAARLMALGGCLVQRWQALAIDLTAVPMQCMVAVDVRTALVGETAAWVCRLPELTPACLKAVALLPQFVGSGLQFSAT